MKKFVKSLLLFAGAATVVAGAYWVWSRPGRDSTGGFSGTAAYELVRAQVDFGPRIPGSEAHAKTAEWIVARLKEVGLEVVTQFDHVQAGNQRVPMKNIIGSIDPDHPKRILLSAHWDTRPWADQEAENPELPGLGANDGGSGVAVLLEAARVLKGSKLSVGVDFAFWDVEDMGQSYQGIEFCLGSQYWSRNPHKAGYKALYAINLDMVGASNAQFPQEGYSRANAPAVLEKIQSAARELGLAKYFPERSADSIIDDHLYITRGAGIPAIDIIHLREQGGFPETWHTRRDTLENISAETLEAVGRVIVRVVEQERGED